MDTFLRTHNRLELFYPLHELAERHFLSLPPNPHASTPKLFSGKPYPKRPKDASFKVSSSPILDLVPETKKELLEFDLPLYDPSKALTLDLAVVGGGPAGLAVAQQVSEKSQRYGVRERAKMGRRRRLLLALPLLFINFLGPTSAAGQSSGVCVSPGGRFPSFSGEGKPPRKAARGSRDLTLCRVFRQSTCCDVAQTYPALLLIRRLASTGEASRECLDLWELLECSICDPRVGVQHGPPVICTSLCDKVLEACGNAYFAVDPKTQILSPCGLSDILCGRAREWASNGTELCSLAGFSVRQDVIGYKGADEPFCYGGKASLESIADSWKASRIGSSESEKFNVEDFQQWVREMPISEMVSWAVGGLVLTAGILFISKRKSYSHRQKRAAIYRAAARRLEATKANQRSSGGRG